MNPARTIAQRELRNENAKVIEAVTAGETFIVTRHGEPVAELRPAELTAGPHLATDAVESAKRAGQTFDTAIGVSDPTDVEGAVTEFHRINAEARLIEARAQEPVVRGIRLTAVGEVDKVAQTPLPPAKDITALGRRRMWVGDGWHDAAVYDLDAVLPGVTVEGPAAIVSPFTTIILAPGETARSTTDGDVVIDIGA